MTADPADRVQELLAWAADPDIPPEEWACVPVGVLRAILNTRRPERLDPMAFAKIWAEVAERSPGGRVVVADVVRRYNDAMFGPETWPCLACGKPIRRAVNAPLGTPFYEHVVRADHFAVRGGSS